MAAAWASGRQHRIGGSGGGIGIGHSGGRAVERQPRRGRFELCIGQKWRGEKATGGRI
jgi:hypothetical protein